MIEIFYLLALMWVGWLLLDGLRSGEVWVRGGSKDRFTRSLDINSFAHKVSRQGDPDMYWIHIILYLSAVIIFLWLLITK